LSPGSPSDFKLLKPSTKEEISGDYTQNAKMNHRYFCNKCGVHIFQEGSYEWEGQKIDFFIVNAASFDQPQEGVDLHKIKINYVRISVLFLEYGVPFSVIIT
jgi:hypothetical protein